MSEIKKCKVGGSEAESWYGNVFDINGINWSTCYVNCKNVDSKKCFNELSLTFDQDDVSYVEDKLIKLWNEVNG